MNYEQFVKFQRVRNVEVQSEKICEQVNNQKAFNHSINSGTDYLTHLQSDILEDMPPEMKEDLIRLTQESREMGLNAGIKEITRNDARYKLDEYPVEDLWGESLPQSGFYPG